MREDSRREELIGVCRWLAGSDFTAGTSGNLSVRVPGSGPGAFLITPAAVPYGRITPDRLVLVDAGGPGAHGEPSSEWRMHAAIYRNRPDLEAVVHAHPRAATALSCLRRPIPAFHYSVALAGGGEIPCATYATFGTQALAEQVADALGPRLRACLMANHGLVAAGASPSSALALAREVEALADQYLSALAVGGPVVLDADEMDRVRKQIAVYGEDRPAPSDDSAGRTPDGYSPSRGSEHVEARAGGAAVPPGASMWQDAPAGRSDAFPLVLLVHGSRDPGWKVMFQELADRLSTAGEPDVRLAFLQFEQPDLPSLAADLRVGGVDRIRLLPVFFAPGTHLRDDVPALVRELEASGTAVSLLDAPADRSEFGDALVRVLAGIAAR